MRFVVDNQLPPRLSKFLEEAGHDSVHVAMVGLGNCRREALVEAFSRSLPVVVAAFGEGQRVVEIG